ncbi:S8 family serine peptidase [Trueperella pecoris]|uniref:S8 family serine peptidase n=1 Tax=Trueperella pecoris TaxID=2733571 RepID=A0A7M1QSB3_9ACTO|nr:S8 family serine peptidase [Trueperella pecoris]QOR44960.1 S8 family serine peptidase [Trueperella pecoris]
MKRKLISGLAVVALSLAVAVPARAVPEPPPLPPASDLTFVDETVPVIVTLEKQATGKDSGLVAGLAKDLAAKYGLTIDRQFSYLVNAFSAQAPASALRDLALEPGVASVDRMRLYYPTMESALGLTQVDKAAKSYGVDGRGLVVSIVDSGIDTAHQDMVLDSDVSPRIAPTEGFTAKIPYGYNFADENTQVKDTTASQHGMHVAGIVAANGGDEANVVSNGRVNGVAPNAQLLAMKVFSNNPKKKGARGDDVMAAIEESVKRGADVINLSLGSPNGHEGQSLGEQRVIAKARAAGVEVIVAVGNEGQNGSTSGSNDDALGYLDDGTVGAPSTGNDAWSVASIENSKVVRSLGIASSNGKEHRFGYDLQAGQTDEKEYELADAGYGSIDDTLNKDFAGKIMLIQRGGKPGTEPLTFADKFKSAEIAKAAGVIVYNHEKGGDEIPGMAGIEKFTFPGAAIGHSDGLALVQMIKAGKTTVKLTNDRTVADNPASVEPSSFTSWGSAPELGFKPEIAGIGGNVYSTINDNKYGTKSGTSMAAPHVAGVAALMIERGAKDNPELSRGELVKHNRIALSNTARIPMKGDVPFAPRQVGAGLVQVQDALATRVSATVNGLPNVALKEVKGQTSFTVTLTNDAAEERTFTAGATCVVNENNSVKDKAQTYCSTTDSIVASGTKVTVPAGGSANVTYTLTTSGDPHWTQGWATFTSNDEGQPDISVPYLGFAGDWNAERIVDYPSYKGQPKPILSALGSIPTHTSLYTTINSGEYTFGDGEQFISPNGDKLADRVYAKLAMLRNAKKLQVSVLDAQGNHIRDVGMKDEVTRPTIKAQVGMPANAMQVDLAEYAFDGRVYNAQKAAFEDVPDGAYQMRISTTIGEGFEPQILDMPFGIDRVAPVIEVLSTEKNADGDYVVKVKATDDYSGVNAVQGRFTAPAGLVVKDEKPQGDVHTLVIKGEVADKVGYFEIYASDRATNVVRHTVMLGDNKLLLDSDETLKKLTHIGKTSVSDQTDEELVRDGKLVLSGHASTEIVSVRAGDASAKVAPSGRFELNPAVSEGTNTITVEGLNAAGQVVASKVYSFVYDPKAPVVTISAPRDLETIQKQVATGTVHIRGTVADNIDTITSVTILGEQYDVVDGAFAADVHVEADMSNLSVYARDKAGNLGVGALALMPADEAKPLELKANLGFDGNFNVVSGDNEALTRTGENEYSFSYKGAFNRATGKFIVRGKEVTVGKDGTFETEVPLKEGITDFNVTIIDTNGKELVNAQIKVLLDLHAPNIEMTKPNIHPDGAIYLREPGEVEFAGSVSDNAFGYKLSINGDVVEEFLTLDDPSAEVNKRNFSKKINAKDADKVLVLLRDQVDNTYLQLIPVIVDGQAPQVKVDGLTADEQVPANQTREVKVSVEDEHLSGASVYLDGKLVDARQSVIRTAKGAGTVINEDFGKVKTKESAPGESAPLTAGNDDADAQAAAAAGSEADQEAPEGEGHTLLTFTVGPEFAVGKHELFVTASDKAGNRTDVAIPFAVEVEDESGKGGQSEGGQPSDQIIVPGIEDKDLVDLTKRGPDGWSTWEPGKVTDREVVASASAKKPLSHTGAAVTTLGILAGSLLLVGVAIRKRTRSTL